MLRSTFLHMLGVGAKREAMILDRGITDWEAAAAADLAWLGARSAMVRTGAVQSIARLDARDAQFFSARLPGYLRYRLHGDFAQDTAYLDIETDPYHVTLVGVYFRDEYRVFIRGRDLDQFPQFMARVKLLVTYNGAGFDLPVLLRTFWGGRPHRAPRGDGIFNPPRGAHLPGAGHIDLMAVLHRQGIRGGLKASEARLGIIRPPEVQGLDGNDAVYLWSRYLRGDRGALDLLIAYNRQDVINLKRIVDLFEPAAWRVPVGTF